MRHGKIKIFHILISAIISISLWSVGNFFVLLSQVTNLCGNKSHDIIIFKNSFSVFSLQILPNLKKALIKIHSNSSWKIQLKSLSFPFFPSRLSITGTSRKNSAQDERFFWVFIWFFLFQFELSGDIFVLRLPFYII